MRLRRQVFSRSLSWILVYLISFICLVELVAMYNSIRLNHFWPKILGWLSQPALQIPVRSVIFSEVSKG